MDWGFLSSVTHSHDTVPDLSNETPSTPPAFDHSPPPNPDQSNDYVSIVVSYDIVCQWSVHLWERMKDFPERLKIDREGKNFIFLIPKFHLPAHVEKCQTSYSFNFTLGVGRTDGEAPERGWSHINPVSTSTKEMGPASYRETIDDHFGDWNHKKVVGLGTSLSFSFTYVFSCFRQVNCLSAA